MGELLGQGEAHAVGRIAVDKAAVSDKADDPGLPDTVRGPANGPEVGVVQGVLVSARGTGRVGRLNRGVQGRVVLIGVVVIGGLLPHRVGRIADDDLNLLFQLRRGPLVVGHEHALIQRVPVLGHLEGVGQDDSVEGRVTGLRGIRGITVIRDGQRRVVAHEVAVGDLDIRRRDVVGQQQNLVGVQLAGVLARQVCLADETRLQEPDDEGPRPGEGVEHMHALIGYTASQVGAGQPVHAAQNEVDDLYRRVDDPQ